MVINPEIEFYRFTLNHKKEGFKTFRDCAIEELRAAKNPTDEKVVEACFKHFIQSLKTDYAKDDKLKKKIDFVLHRLYRIGVNGCVAMDM
jgi:hypothetical protein